MTRQMISLCLECQKWDEESQLREQDFDIPTFFFFFPVGDSTWLQHQQVVAQSGTNTLNFDYNWENWSKGGIDKVNLNIGTHKMEANSVAQPMSQI